MTRPRYGTLALIVCGCLVGGCSDDSAGDPTEGTTASSDAPAGVTRDSTAEANPICQLFGDDDLLPRFTSVTSESDTACRFSTEYAEYVQLTVDMEHQPLGTLPGGRPSTFDGHPAARTDQSIVVSLGDSLDEFGYVRADNALLNFGDPVAGEFGGQLVSSMLRTVLTEYAR